MRIMKSELKSWYRILLSRFGNNKFCVHDVKQIFIDMSPNHIGKMLRLMWFDGYSNRNGRDKKTNVIYYTLRIEKSGY